MSVTKPSAYLSASSARAASTVPRSMRFVPERFPCPQTCASRFHQLRPRPRRHLDPGIGQRIEIFRRAGPAEARADRRPRGGIAESPIAVNTRLGFTLPDEQAEPALTAKPARSRPMIWVSEGRPSTPKQETPATRGAPRAMNLQPRRGRFQLRFHPVAMLRPAPDSRSCRAAPPRPPRRSRRCRRHSPCLPAVRIPVRRRSAPRGMARPVSHRRRRRPAARQSCARDSDR